MRKSKNARSLAKKTTGTRLRSKPVDTARRALKRLQQASRAYARKHDNANEARMKALEAGTWPAPSVLVVQPEQLDGAIAKCVLGVPLSAAEVAA